MLKNRLSEYVKMVAAGEVVLVTDRDRVVAELIPPRQGRSEAIDDARLAEAVRNGWIRTRLTGPGTAPPRAPVTRWNELSEELEADRGER